MFDIDTLAGKEQVLELALAKTQYYCDVEEDPKNIFTHLDRYIKKSKHVKDKVFSGDWIAV